MSTHDVPGAVESNHDELAMGCWAEHDDGSLLFVESTEGGRVIYSVFNMAMNPPVEYRDAMPLKGFQNLFSWSKKKTTAKPKKRVKKMTDIDEDGLLEDVMWTWHDKTPFPWDRVIEAGTKDGVRHVSVEDQLNAALRVAKSRRLLREGKPINTDKFKSFIDQMGVKGRTIKDKIERAIHELGV